MIVFNFKQGFSIYLHEKYDSIATIGITVMNKRKGELIPNFEIKYCWIGNE